MKLAIPLASLALCLFATEANAVTISDATADFLPSFVGPNDADLDVTSFTVSFDGVANEFILGAVLAGVINPARAGLYVIGVNTGTGPIAPFGPIGAPNVRFNQVVIVQKNGTGSVTGPSGGPLAAGAITIAGNLFTARVPLAFLPTTGFGTLDYRWNLWPRNGLGNNNQISDFAPDDGGISVLGVPEPASWGMALLGFALVGGAMRRRTKVSFSLA